MSSTHINAPVPTPSDPCTLTNAMEIDDAPAPASSSNPPTPHQSTVTDAAPVTHPQRSNEAEPAVKEKEEEASSESSSSSSDETGADAMLGRQDKETLRKDRSLAELLTMMDEYKPILPDSVTDYYTTRSGFECPDARVKRLLALAAQKFVSDIAVDALQYSRIRSQQPLPKDRRSVVKDKRTVLTVDDLSAALADHGVNIRKPEYYL
ncbi:transcription initiation factor TFIID 23-30kDa subunit-domain-containing protein [Fimicolochytrium jonesii]|uniref:transcription initiation factor TFIID 23-30kDa subunit-domain-containing protein n=1 Tax=Fimicolochytrium jonesii TaxID=1396493 RepID=UPI0022FDFAB7|nr:transcription initiation factor TFIID 23-30kDa subunit-domain-containing protein [Fimicolochytrium jonesii]KAI8824578.1 transcription initiation factor TFIID 23-30kDa subunit-domain-containing protein [Fimicolochytrium jonesii]